MELPIETTLHGLTVLHEGNHNELGNPHDQYNVPIFTTSTSDNSSMDNYTKVFEYTFERNNHPQMYAEIDFWEFSSDSDEKMSGKCFVDYRDFTSQTSNRKSHLSINYIMNNSEIGQLGNVHEKPLFVAVEEIVGNDKKIIIYMNLLGTYYTMKFSPVVCAVSNHRSWSMYNYSHVSRDKTGFLSKQGITTFEGIKNAHPYGRRVNGHISNSLLKGTYMLPASYHLRGINYVRGFEDGKPDILSVCLQNGDYSHSHKRFLVTTNFEGKPTSGYFDRGAISINPDWSNGSYFAYICVSSGSPGVWRRFGQIVD